MTGIRRTVIDYSSAYAQYSHMAGAAPVGEQIAMTILTPAALAQKGISKRDVKSLLRRSEARVNSYTRQYARNGFKCSERFRESWDAECARWDHFKATLAGFEGGAA